MRLSMPWASSFAKSDERASSSSSTVGSRLLPDPGIDVGGASTRVFVRGRPNVVVVATDGGGGGGDEGDNDALAPENSGRRSRRFASN